MISFDLQGRLVLGSVGSNNWRGSLYEVEAESLGTHIEDPKMGNNSYMGNDQNQNAFHINCFYAWLFTNTCNRLVADLYLNESFGQNFLYMNERERARKCSSMCVMTC